MKNLSMLLRSMVLLLSPIHTLHAQICTNPVAQIDIHGNNIRARLLNAGDLFWDLEDGIFIANEVAGGPSKPSSIFSAALWIGGITPENNIAFAGVQYRNDEKTDFWAGPLSESGLTEESTCQNWDRFFRVKGVRIAQFLDTLPTFNGNSSLAIEQFKDVMGWPGKGNPYFVNIWGFDLPFSAQALAPFFDSDGDGDYDPLQGDYPVVQLQNGVRFVPAEIIWCVFNDHGGGSPHTATGGRALNIEVQLTTWAFNCVDQPVLNNTVFTAHKIIHRGDYTLDSCHVGLFADLDIGCYTDDRAGCAPDLSAFYAYNADAVDNSPCITSSFGNKPPVQSVTFLNKSLDKFISFANAVTGPAPTATNNPASGSIAEYYGALTGSWRDGRRLTYGGTGYLAAGGGFPTDYAFPGNPSNPSDWSMCHPNIAGDERRMVGTHVIGVLLPGQIEELVAAWTYHPLQNYIPCNVDTALAEIAGVRAQYEQGFAQVCDPVSSTKHIDKPLNVNVFPNPAHELVTIQYGDLRVRAVQCYNPLGILVRTVENPAGRQCTLDVAGLESGIYLLNIRTEQGDTVVKVNILNR